MKYFPLVWAALRRKPLRAVMTLLSVTMAFTLFGLMIGYGLRLSAAGIAAGLMAALMLTEAMTSMLVGIKPTDPITFAAMAALFLLIAVAATWLPARRAAALDPSAALREE